MEILNFCFRLGLNVGKDQYVVTKRPKNYHNTWFFDKFMAIEQGLHQMKNMQLQPNMINLKHV